MEYTDVTDPEYQATRAESNEPDCFWVKPTDYSMVPNQSHGWEPLPCFLPKEYASMAQRIKDLPVRPDDVWIASYPKSGTTWTQEMMWLICNNLDYAGARAVTLHERFPFLEVGCIVGNDSVKKVEEIKSPRFVKTHLPVALMPDQFWTVKPKLVYVHRKAKPVAVSFYHHYQMLTGYRGSIEQYVKAFINDRIMFSPYHEHVLEFHALQSLDNILVINYEDMKKDLKHTVLKVCSFFNKTYTGEQIQQLCKHLSFDSMKNNPSVNYDEMIKQIMMCSNRLHEHNDRKFIRKGEIDGWKSDLTEELANEIDEWTRSKFKSAEHLNLFL